MVGNQSNNLDNFMFAKILPSKDSLVDEKIFLVERMADEEM
jgi:hypothetical protein